MRTNVRAFPEQLLAQGLLCWHHFEELLAIEDDAIVEARLAFIESLPFIAWIQSLDEPHSRLDSRQAENALMTAIAYAQR